MSCVASACGKFPVTYPIPSNSPFPSSAAVKRESPRLLRTGGLAEERRTQEAECRGVFGGEVGISLPSK